MLLHSNKSVYDSLSLRHYGLAGAVAGIVLASAEVPLQGHLRALTTEKAVTTIATGTVSDWRGLCHGLHVHCHDVQRR